MTVDSTCGWNTGTVYSTYPQRCGKTAKARVEIVDGWQCTDNGLVCGIHLRSYRRYQSDGNVEMLDGAS